MSDNTQPTPEAPAPIDVEHVHAQHKAWLATMDAEDPTSLYYKKPEAAARARAEANLQHEVLQIRFGIAPAPERTPASLAAERFQNDWKFVEQRAPFEIELEAAAEAATAGMSTEAHEAAVKALQLRIGGERWDQLASNSMTMPSAPRAYYAAVEGERKWLEMVEQAKATLAPGESLPRGVLLDERALSLRAVHGRAILARTADRARSRLA